MTLVKSALEALFRRFNKYKDDKSFMSNEKQACQSLIVPLIGKVLNWDTEDPAEFKAEESRGGKRIDYVVYYQGISQFIIEAKAPIKDIFDNAEMYQQALEYGYGKDHEFAILTNFRQIVILACKKAVRVPQEAEMRRLDLLNASEEDLRILSYFEKDFWLTQGRENPLYKLLGRQKRRAPVDEQLLEDLQRWRLLILKNLRKHERKNRHDWQDKEELMHLEEEVQRFINRLLFIAYCEDKELKEPELRAMLHDKDGRYALKPGWMLSKLKALFEEYRRVYDSDLFDKNTCDDFYLDDEVVYSVIEDLRRPKHRLAYDFKSIEADVLGRAYENFIGHVLTGKKRFKEKTDVGKRKKEGIYYTPKYIVDYIVNQTVRDKAHGKKYEEILKLKVLDPACGSGSFLIRAYDVLVEEAERSLKRPLTYAEKKRLMLSCIYGVDLDERAREIAKLNLSLRLAARGEKLPMLADNIRLGNSLIDDATIAGFKAFHWEHEFKEIMEAGGFDVIIGNPPYIRIQTLDKKEVEWFKQRHVAAGKGNYDIYVLFVEKALQLLSQEGRLGFILPHKFFNAKYGEGLRRVIAEGKHLSEIVHFSDQQVFKGATTYTCLLFLDKRPKRKFTFKKVKDLEAWREKGDAEEGKIETSKTTAKEWNFVVGGEAELKSKLDAWPIKLKDIAERIGQGIRTSANEVYVLDVIERRTDNLLVKSRINPDVFEVEVRAVSNFLQGREIKSYDILDSGKVVIMPYEIKEKQAILLSPLRIKKEYSFLWNYLEKHKKYLEKRENNRFRGSSWYMFGRQQNIDLMLLPKILVPDIADRAAFAFDENGKYAFTSGYGITLEEDVKESMKYILGLLNSRLLNFYIKHISTPLRGGFFRYFRQYLSQLPIRTIDFDNPEEKALHDKMVLLVDKMLDLHKQLQALSEVQSAEREALQKEIERTDKEIDNLVYRLYGITEEERKIIEKV